MTRPPPDPYDAGDRRLAAPVVSRLRWVLRLVPAARLIPAARLAPAALLAGALLLPADALAAPAPVGPPGPGSTPAGPKPPAPPAALPGATLQLGGDHVPAAALRPFGAVGPSVGVGAASVTVVLLDLPGGYRVDATLDGATLTLADPGQGFLVGTFRGEPRRFVQLQLVANGGVALLDALVAVPDQERALLAWDVVRDGSKLLAVRAPVAPSLATDLGADSETAARVKWGWGGLALAWVLGLLGAWAASARRAA